MIAYCPIDVPRISVNDQLVKTLVDSMDTGHHDGLWKCLPLIGRVQSQVDFKSAEAFELAWEKRYSLTGAVLVNQQVLEKLPALFAHIMSLPLKVTHAQILCQTADVGKHYDLKHEGMSYFDDYPGINDEVEPAGYKVLLNQTDRKSFYVAEAFGKTNHYIVLPSDTNTFVINEKTFPHGAKKLDDEKYIVSIFGLIDKEKHLELVKRSAEKYPSFVIQF